MKPLILLTILLVTNLSANSNPEISKKLDQFHIDLQKKSLLVRHELNLHIKEFKETGDQSKIKHYLNNLKIFSRKMNVSQSSKDLIYKRTSSLVNFMNVQPIIKSTKIKKQTKSLLKKELTNKKIVLQTRDAQMKEPLNLIQDFHPDTGLLSSIPNTQLVIYTITLLSLAGLLLTYRLKKKTIKAELSLGSKKNNDKAFTKATNGSASIHTYADLKTPVVLIDDKEVITWLNDTARSNFKLGEGETFFLEHELKLKEKTDILTYQKAKINYNVYVRLNTKANFKVLTFISTVDNAYSSVTEVEGSQPLAATISRAVESTKYLFTNSGIPLVIDNRLSDKKNIDEKVGDVISKTLKIAYDMSKNTKNSRVNYTLDEVDGTSCFKIDFKNQKKSDIRWNESISNDESTLAEAWGELELSLANRQGRVFIYDDEDLKSMSFQLMFENTVYEKGMII